MADEAIRAGKVVTVRYTLRSDKGEVLETSDGDSYLHGSGTIPRGLERALEGKKLHDRLKVKLSAADGFGPKQKSAGPQPIPRSTFPADAELKPGMQFSAEGPNGQPVTLYITRVDSQTVHVDTNHPFAGRALEYEVEITGVRDATAAEKRG